MRDGNDAPGRPRRLSPEAAPGRAALVRAAPWAVATLLLLLALVASRTSDAVAWGGEDFAAAAALLFGAFLAWELARRLFRRRPARAAAAAAILLALALAWAELAVGIFGP